MTTVRHNLKADDEALALINKVRAALRQRGVGNPDTSDVIRELYSERNLSQKLCSRLINFAGEYGDNEGAVDVLDRLLHELADLRAKTH
ncbi:MAG: hypothetical protein PHW62_00870 [Candidatus Ratteibacteria bacterium]|nr:hypothetical protein [Candidatus Ratteibacteria bacterium]